MLATLDLRRPETPAARDYPWSSEMALQPPHDWSEPVNRGAFHAYLSILSCPLRLCILIKIRVYKPQIPIR